VGLRSGGVVIGYDPGWCMRRFRGARIQIFDVWTRGPGSVARRPRMLVKRPPPLAGPVGTTLEWNQNVLDEVAGCECLGAMGRRVC